MRVEPYSRHRGFQAVKQSGVMSKGEVTTGPDSEAAATPIKSKGLRGGALGLLSSVVVGLASMAPAYSLAATLGLIVASGGGQLSGVKAPAVVLISFIPMYLIAVASSICSIVGISAARFFSAQP